MNLDKILQTLATRSAKERDNVRANAERWKRDGTPQQKADATRLLEAMAAQEASERQALIERLSALPVAQRVAEAFGRMPMTETERSLIQVLLDNPGATSTELSRALGWEGQTWHMHFGTMCKHREVYLWPAPPSDQPNKDFYSGILADLSEGSHWTMKPDVAAAFAAMGITPASRG